MSNDKFFFEEDPKATEATGLTWAEHTDAFFGALGKDGTGMSLEPHAVVVEMKTEHKSTSLVDVEYGTVKADYVIHITPLHPQRNLAKGNLVEQAMEATLKLLVTVVPHTLRVDICKPRPKDEIKVLSFIIREGAETWNLDTKKIEAEVVPQLLEQIGKICMIIL
jgi:hypothetical protein